MTEAEWNACTDSGRMLEFLRGKANDRKLRLFAVAVCRLLTVPSYYSGKFRRALLRGIQAAEEYADSILDDYQASNILEETVLATSISGRHPLIFAVCRSLWPNATEVAQEIARGVLPVSGAGGILPELFGPLPFRPVVIDPAWLTWNSGTISKLAIAAYDDRNLPAGTLQPARLAVLADALEEAGCQDADILDHLRSPGPHVRGCWPVDLILGKK